MEDIQEKEAMTRQSGEMAGEERGDGGRDLKE